MHNFWQFSVDNICRELQVDLNYGLVDIEARCKKFGKNTLPQKKKISTAKIFIRQFASLMVALLIVAAVIAGILQEVIDSIVILGIVFLNAILGFLQEYKAEKSLEALKKLTSPTSKVIRKGKELTILSEEVVVGDVLLLKEGELIPADGRVVSSTHLLVNESTLTGESAAIQKISNPIKLEKLAIAERKNMVFRGTSVLAGKAKVIVTQVGLMTEIGKIATSLEKQEKKTTPLQAKLKEFGKKLIFLCLGIIFIIFLIGLFKGYQVTEMILIALSLSVAAVPEGLPAIITVSLAIGIKKMVKQNALIRRLHSVETLGSATVICTDKTGTLTQNKMVVEKIFVNNSEFEVTEDSDNLTGKYLLNNKEISIDQFDDLKMLLTLGVLCNDASFNENQPTGDPTEVAILVAAKKVNLTKKILSSESTLIDELPFQSERKKMSVLRYVDNQKLLLTKGALDELVEKSISIHKNGNIYDLAESEKRHLLELNDNYAREGLRIIGAAYKKDNLSNNLVFEDEKDLVFLGFFIMKDPPRPEVKEAISQCKMAGIKIIMITGDHKETAVAIGKQLNLMDEKSLAINGDELDEMSDYILREKVQHINVISRATAHHKLRIINALKFHKNIVAMTGDGVNDALAIKGADIGIAMGITGTEVTKEASDMVILDDNFTSIEHAIKEGRGIFVNIQKFVGYLLSANIAEILVIFMAMIFSFKDKEGNFFAILTPIQILWLNLITDGMPALAMSVDPVNVDVMRQKPRRLSDSILSIKLTLQLLLISLLVTVGTLVACYFGLNKRIAYAQTMAFTTLVTLELVVAQVIRYRFKMTFFSNYWLLTAITVSFVLHLLIIYLPSLNQIFDTISLEYSDWVIIGIITGIFTSISYFFMCIIKFMDIKKS